MNRLFRAAMVAAILPIGLTSVGCAHKSGSACGSGGCGAGGDGGGGLGACYRNLVDVSWPDRYNYAARQSVVAPFAQQAATGHFLNQTIWNFYFDPGTDKLNAGGMEKLDSLAHATPGPDPRIYLQHTHDLGVPPENMAKAGALHNDLDARRAAAIRRYMATQFGPPMEYEVLVHDAPTPKVYGVFVGNAFRGQTLGYVGGINSRSINVSSVGGSASGPAPGSGGNTVVNTGPAPAPTPGP